MLKGDKMSVLFVFSVLVLAGLGAFLYMKYLRKEEPVEYIWMGKGENPLKNMR